jgi:hypothetical protein
MGRSKPVRILDKHFASIKETENFFSEMKNKYPLLEEIKSCRDFDLLSDLLTRYCAQTGWSMPNKPVAFFVNNPPHEVGETYYSTTCFFAKFADDSVKDFSVNKAITSIAGL